VKDLLYALKERAKELSCLYRVDEIVSREADPEDVMLGNLVEVIPPGWQYPEICVAGIRLGDRSCGMLESSQPSWTMRSEITVRGEPVGEIAVSYTDARPEIDEGPFLREERKLLDTIAERIGQYVLHKRLHAAFRSYDKALQSITSGERREWGVILNFLRRTDPGLLARITRKMINHLAWSHAAEADDLLRGVVEHDESVFEDNRPSSRTTPADVSTLTERTFEVASRRLGEAEIVGCLQRWIQEDKTGFLTDTLENPASSLSEIANAIERYHGASVDEEELPHAVASVLRVSLLRRFFTDELGFIRSAKDHVTVADFRDLAHRVIGPDRSHGQLGGKSAGLFLASRVVRRAVADGDELLADIAVPKTWYVTSDALVEFIHNNNLEDLYTRKYLELDQIRQDYPRIVSLFKNCRLPSQIRNGLSVALDDFESRPLIVRSSSHLEDRTGAAFSGKYKSLFLANQGSKAERLTALEDAIAEVYASIFGPDPIEYRAERGMLDLHEGMGIMIQEVVGRRIGRYFLPAFSGVAFGNNEFRWSPRIKREDGLVRMVPGLGTRAVDRLSDDYPVLAAPGQPALRVNATPEETVRYSPKKADVINLATRQFETVDVSELLKEFGDEYPSIRHIVSRIEDGRLVRPIGLGLDFDDQEYAVTFEGVISDTPFLAQVRSLLTVLEKNLGGAVDLEFAHDGERLYLLQCRAQSYSRHEAPAAIPRNVAFDRLLFTANRYISNGIVSDLTHVVYVDPEAYASLSDAQALREVGRAVGRLNELLPKRQFLLVGPGRWGSRGDIKLGVSVRYSDINNTAVLVEVARQKGNYVPDLSFGTHFFQDLVEAGIRYLPLYPDEPGVVFNETFLRRARNLLPDIAPEFADLAEVVQVVDVPAEIDGKVVCLLMNAEIDEAVAMFVRPSNAPERNGGTPREESVESPSDEHWRWRLFMAERIAAALPAGRFGVVALYVFGSTKNGTAGPGSDIDLLVHFRGDESERRRLDLWMDGWSRCLAETNYLRTGHRVDRLLDVHVVGDEDVQRQSGFAVKIGAVTDAARPLELGADSSPGS
jgi:hypothetical protein